MKKLIAVAGALALAACGGNAEEAETTETAETAAADRAAAASPAPAANTLEVAGTYTEMDTIETASVVDVNADGTYTVMSGETQEEAGAWEQNAQGLCMTPTGGEELCFAVAETSEAGVRTITSPDGEAIRFAFVAE